VTPTVGSSATLHLTVTDKDTASAVGSGDVPVLATPRLVAVAEGATIAALAAQLAPGQTSVGTRIELEHVYPSRVGERVSVTATLAEADGRELRFDITARSARDRLVATGKVTRAVVDRERFLARVADAPDLPGQ
jgi:fluoroacetyl-CoA thioesterase